MSLVKKPFFLVLAIGMALLPAVASAQDPKFRVSLGGGTTAGAIDGQASATLSLGYRFSKMFSFDVELAGIDGAADGYASRELDLGSLTGSISTVTARVGDIFASLRRGFPNSPGLPANPAFNTFPAGFSISNGGETLLSTVGFRFHIPSSDPRFRPYVSAGLGVARTEESFDIRVLAADTRNTRTTSVSTSLYTDEVSHTGLAGGAGVGAAIRVWKGLSFGVDARYYRLDRGRDLGTFGGSISYGF